MTQQDIAVQPRETAVTAALRTYAGIMGFCVTHTTDGQHATHSYHYTGRAVDLADRFGPGVDTSQLLAINEKVIATLPLSMISELIYAGLGGICVQNGRVVNGLSVFGPETMAGHHNHVHLAVVDDFVYTSPYEEMPMATHEVAAAFPYQNGYVIILSNGNAYCFGCDFKGGVTINDDGTVTVNNP